MWERKIEDMCCTVMIMRALKHKRSAKRKPLMLLFAFVCKIPSQFDWLLSDPPGSKLSIWDNIMLPNALPPPTYLIAFHSWQPWRENPLVFTLQPHRLKIPMDVQPRRLLKNTAKNKIISKEGRARKSRDSCWLSRDVYLKHESAKWF